MALTMSGRRLPIVHRGNEPRLHPEEALEAYKEIAETLKAAFSTDHESGGPKEVNWPAIKTCLRSLKRYFHELKLFWKTIYTIFVYFEERKDPELSPTVADILYFALFESYYAYFILPLKDLPRVPSVLCDGYNQGLHNVILDLMRQPYRVFRTVIIPEVDVVWSSVMMDSEKLLPVLLRQGVVYIPPSSHIKGWDYCIGVLNNICHLEDAWQDFDPASLSIKLKAQNPVVRQRIFTVFRAMDVVQHALQTLFHMRISWEGDMVGNYHDRYCMVFDTIPEPIVTLQEVRRILEKVFEPVHSEAVKSFCSKFEDFMPESVGPTTPRSLRHLCRFQIRESLRVKGVYPYGVFDLPIPPIVKKYLLLENWYNAEAAKSANENLPFPDWAGHEEITIYSTVEPHFLFSYPLLSDFEIELVSPDDEELPSSPGE